MPERISNPAPTVVVIESHKGISTTQAIIIIKTDNILDLHFGFIHDEV